MKKWEMALMCALLLAPGAQAADAPRGYILNTNPKLMTSADVQSRAEYQNADAAGDTAKDPKQAAEKKPAKNKVRVNRGVPGWRIAGEAGTDDEEVVQEKKTKRRVVYYDVGWYDPWFYNPFWLDPWWDGFGMGYVAWDLWGPGPGFGPGPGGPGPGPGGPGPGGPGPGGPGGPGPGGPGPGGPKR